MNKFEKIWDELKQDPEKNEILTISQNVSSIISKIVIERNKKGLSQRDLARLTGLKQSAIARMESLQAIPRIDTIAKICFHLDLNFSLETSEEKPKYIMIYKFDTPIADYQYYMSSKSYTDSYIHESEDKGYSSCIS